MDTLRELLWDILGEGIILVIGAIGSFLIWTLKQVLIVVPNNSFAVVQDTDEVLASGLHFRPCRKLVTVTWTMQYIGSKKQKTVTFVKKNHRMANFVESIDSNGTVYTVLVVITILVNEKILFAPQPFVHINDTLRKFCDDNFISCKHEFTLNYDILTLQSNVLANSLREKIEKLKFAQLTGLSIVSKARAVEE